jgi:stage II sporulation protein D
MRSSRLLSIGALFFLLSCRAVPETAVRATATPAPSPVSESSAERTDFKLPRTIKVSLVKGRRSFTIGCTGRYVYETLKKDKPTEVNSKTVLQVRGVKGGMVIGRKKFTSTVRVTPLDSGARLMVNQRAYRGIFLIRPSGGGSVSVIEEVGLEEYLNGVLPREVGADWPVESLKAQAVISRTYVLANIRRSAGKGYDVTSDVFSQVYGGLKDEHSETNAAVRATQGEILLDDAGLPVLTFFHSSCGGRTENVRYVWQEVSHPPEYLDSVKDSYCKDDPFNQWEFNIHAERLQQRLRRRGFRVGVPTKISAAKRSPSDRISIFLIESSKGRVQVPGNTFRLAVGADQLRSTFVSTIERRGKTFHFEGKGWGHGVGLCQWGARGRALEGHSYTQIIDAYYPGARLVKASGS